MPTEAVLTVEPGTLTEGAGPTTLTVTATWKGEGVRDTATEISLTVQAGTASSTDYSVTPSVLVIAAEARSGTAQIVVTALSDTLREGDEKATIVGSSPGITVTGAEVTILDRLIFVSFAESRLTVTEGETAEIVIQYQLGDLTEPWTLDLSFLGDSASQRDYEVTGTSVTIPAGRAVSGEASVSLTALLDRFVSEGEETVLVRFASPVGEAPAPLGPDLEITILEGGGMPCAGVVVRADPPERRESVTRTALTMEWESGARGSFDWAGPYYDDEEDPENRNRTPVLEVNVAEWRVETTQTATRHTLEIEWPPFLSARLRFSTEECGGNAPELRCGRSACELRP